MTKTNANATENINVCNSRKGIRAVIDATASLKSVCAQINASWGESIEVGETTMKVSEFIALWGYEFGAKGITPAALLKVWHSELRTNDGSVAMYVRKTAKFGDKVVYEYDANKKAHRTVGMYHLEKVEKWSVRVVLMGLFYSWSVETAKNMVRRNKEHIDGIKKFYVTASEKATQKSARVEMQEVAKSDVEF